MERHSRRTEPGTACGVDGPGGSLSPFTGAAPGSGEAFRSLRANFREFVRIQFGGSAFGAGGRNANGEIDEEGSRASAKTEWAFRAYRVRNGTATQMTPDTTATTLSGTNVAVPGTTFTVLGPPPAPGTDSFGVSYSGTGVGGTYTLTNSVGGSIFHWGVTSWSVGFSGQIQVNLTTVSPNFFEFALFTTATTYAGGKTNWVGLTSPLPLDAP